MKMLILIAALIFGSQTFAHDGEHSPEGKDFNTFKAELLKHVDEKIAKLTEHKACITAAADKEALKKCHESMKEFRHDMKEHRKEMREEMKEKRKGKKE